MAALTTFKDDNKNMMLMQSSWAAKINPILANPTNNILILKDISLIAGATTINHLLGQKQQGWIILDIDGAATIYRSQPLNDKTLTLTSDAAVNVTLGVF